MSITQNSKIKVRSGLRQNLPLLDKGEFGWCTDTQELFIGNGTINDGAPFSGVTLINGHSGGGGNISMNMVAIAGIPDGVVDGSNTIFTIPSVPITNSLIVWQNFPLIPGVGYTLTGTTIDFALAPIDTDALYYQYWITI